MRIEPFNDKAHEVLSQLIDRAEDRAIREGLCDPDLAEDFLTGAYIEQCDSYMNHAQCYLENEERLAAYIFLHGLNKFTRARISERKLRVAARQLATRTEIYFTNFKAMLRLAFLKVLSGTHSEAELRRSGIVILAVANLPGIRTDVRRELRRRGATFDSLLVRDDILCRMNRKDILPNTDPNRRSNLN